MVGSDVDGKCHRGIDAQVKLTPCQYLDEKGRSLT